jgi:hypothetical protein
MKKIVFLFLFSVVSLSLFAQSDSIMTYANPRFVVRTQRADGSQIPPEEVRRTIEMLNNQDKAIFAATVKNDILLVVGALPSSGNPASYRGRLFCENNQSQYINGIVTATGGVARFSQPVDLSAYATSAALTAESQARSQGQSTLNAVKADKTSVDTAKANIRGEMSNNINYGLLDIKNSTLSGLKFLVSSARSNMYIGVRMPNETLATGGAHNGSELNTFLGFDALRYLTTGFANTAIGAYALNANTSGNTNTAIGNQSLAKTTTGSQNTALGNDVGWGNTTGGDNVYIGMHTVGSPTVISTGSRNTYVGSQIGKISHTSGADNSFFGALVGYNVSTASRNTALGSAANRYLTTGTDNSALGYEAGHFLVTANGNSYIGYRSGRGNIEGYNNVAVGLEALTANTSNQNTAIGARALTSNTSGTLNVAVGNNAGYYNTGSYNVFIGDGAGLSAATTHSNILIGSNVGTGATEQYAIGAGNLVIGNSVSAVIYGKITEREITLNAKTTIALDQTPIFSDNASAIASGLAVGRVYRKATGELMIVF